MDDINFGVNDRDEAHRILGEVNDVLKSRGLALNLGKTEILTPSEVRTHFLVAENKKLSRRQARAAKLKSDVAREKLATKLYEEFEAHLDNCRARNKEKLTKPYLTVFRMLRSPLAIRHAVWLFLSEPGLRAAAVRYISHLPFSIQTTRALLALLKRAPRYDDLARLEVIKAIVDHSVPTDARGRRFVSRVAKVLGAPSSGFDWYGTLLFLAKYGEPHAVLTAAEKARKIAKGDSFLARQIIAVLARAAGLNFSRVLRTWNQEVSRGAADSASVAVSLLRFAQGGFPSKSKAAYQYLFPKKMSRPYPSGKFLLLCAIAADEKRRGLTTPRPEVVKFVVDPWMQFALRRVNNAWFK
jgi:hypothetical protein